MSIELSFDVNYIINPETGEIKESQESKRFLDDIYQDFLKDMDDLQDNEINTSLKIEG